ncbi:beta-microseminoprotein-like isoform X3 [Polyodon spathula]|uniref:beta-microseminoprotein-like isoform X3 n=1 Tax=Polyodon spathula TaxID=7913 RepID=UPI001B7DD8FF|nr:beta-microseminoprotein-like isoform X3 [Polyodon spathula]
MKFLVGSLLLCAVVHLGQSYCYKKELKIKPGEAPPTHCVDTEDGTKHTWGSEWRNSKCMDCTCHSCCTAYSTPVQFPPDCMMEFDQKNCRYSVFKKNDRTVSCPVFGAVGK